MLSVIDLNQEKRIDASLGTMLVGSVLSNQCGLIPPDLKIYFNMPVPKKWKTYGQYPLFLFKETNDFLNTLLI